MNKIAFYWSGIVGLISVVWQIFTYYMRFGKFNEFATVTDYVMFFLAGTLGGLILIFFLNRQETIKGWWVVMIAFASATPVAMIFMLGGGLLSFIGTLIFPQIPWGIFTWLGSILGRFLGKRGSS
ncbi:MAG TPA: hypothetical protein DEP19_02785 [Anaerolineae bacterium]|nr:hypothetical protein [Anaerolineae bacterium]